MVTFAKRAEPGSQRKRWNFLVRSLAKSIFSAKFGPFSKPFSGRARTMTVRNEPVHVMNCVVNVRPPMELETL